MNEINLFLEGLILNIIYPFKRVDFVHLRKKGPETQKSVLGYMNLQRDINSFAVINGKRVYERVDHVHKRIFES